MVIRRIHDHAAGHNWFAVFIDLLIVVVGVFLGTQANNWNEARIERANAAEYRRQIIEDLNSNEVDLASRKAYYGVARSHAIAALTSLESPGTARGEPFLIHAYQASQVWLRPLTRTGYDEMVGAGLTRSIGGKDTRSRLNAYYTQIKQFELTALGGTTFRDSVRRTLPYEAQLAIRLKCGDRVRTLPDGAQVAELPVHCSVGLDNGAVAAGVRALEAADLAEELTRQIADIDQKLSGFDRYVKQAHNLRVHLQSAE